MRSKITVCLTFLLAIAGCSGGDASTPEVDVVVRDSAGIRIVENGGVDRPLAWRFEEVLRLGGAEEGSEAFFRPSVATDQRGRIYVLDAGNHRVVVFDSSGAHLRSMGSEGGGPGELEMPSRMAVLPDGTVGVQDWGKGAIVVWDSAGAIAPQIRLDAPMLWRLHALPDGFVAEFASVSGFGEERDSTSYRLVRLGADVDTSAILTMRVAPGREVDFGCVRISSMEPLFQADLRWTTAGGQLIVARSTDYEVELRDGSGALVALARRDLQPRQATLELAALEVGDSMRIVIGGTGECAVPPERVVEQRGYDDVVPAVRSVIATADGGFLVGRGVGKSDDRTLDLFDATGAYAGTWPPDAPYPNAFLPDGRVVAIERDEYDMPYVVIYRVHRD